MGMACHTPNAQANSGCPVTQKRSKTFKGWAWRWGSDDEHGWDGFVRDNDLLAIVMGADPLHLCVSDHPHSIADNFPDFQLRDSQSEITDEITERGKIFFGQRLALQNDLPHLFPPPSFRVRETTAIAAIPSLRPTKPIWSVVVAFTLTTSALTPSNSASRLLIASLYGESLGA
jgi:hypothetical protein